MLLEIQHQRSSGCVDVDGYEIVDVCKPHQQARLRSLDLLVFPQLCLYAGDFYCRPVDWGYNDNSPDGECWLAWQVLILLPSYTTPRTPPVLTLAAGVLAPIQI